MKRDSLDILFILDPLEKLNPAYDSSLFLVSLFLRRRHRIWIADVPDLSLTLTGVIAKARRITCKPEGHFQTGQPHLQQASRFNMILIRKEPPFDLAYLTMTWILDQIRADVFISNDPRGIRNANEKIASYFFRSFMPKTLVSSSSEMILNFSRSLNRPVVIKPLNRKGGEGMFLLNFKIKKHRDRLEQATARGKIAIVAQELLKPKNPGDKRIFLINGRPVAAYERRPRSGDFRSNLARGGSLHPAVLTDQDRRLCLKLSPFLKKEGLHFSGIDVMAGKLLEINVTCPGGYPEAIQLYPKARLLERWADFLEIRIRGVNS